METVHLIGQFNESPKRNRADERAPPPGAQAHFYQRRHGRRLGKACASTASAMARRWHERRATGVSDR
jgi:hypothetical protein